MLPGTHKTHKTMCRDDLAISMLSRYCCSGLISIATVFNYVRTVLGDPEGENNDSKKNSRMSNYVQGERERFIVTRAC